MSLTPKHWESFQHYKGRRPPWIKLHRALLDNYEFHCLPDASRALAPCIWLLASEYEGGHITLSIPAMAFRLHRSEAEISQALKPLIDSGFIFDDSNVLADRYQDACLETEREREKEKKEHSPVLDATPATTGKKAVAEKKERKREYSEDFDGFWLSYPRSPNMSKLEAWTEWKKLAVEDRNAACAAVPQYRAFLKTKPDLETIHACRFLKKRRFDGFCARGSSGVRSTEEVHAMIRAEQERLANGKG